jgi:hypothetical protein
MKSCDHPAGDVDYERKPGASDRLSVEFADHDYVRRRVVNLVEVERHLGP